METTNRHDLDQLATALLHGQPCYLILASDGLPDWLRDKQALGLTGPRYDLALRPWLASVGRWSGRRPAIYLNDHLAATCAAEIVAEGGGDVAAVTADLLAATMIHELAHVAEEGVDLSPPDDTNEGHATAAVAFAVAAYSYFDTKPGTLPVGYGHSPEFFRLAIHQHHRARLAGCDVPLCWVFDGEQYGLPCDATELADLLNNEQANLQRESIFEISSFTAPLNFRRVFQQTTKGA